MPRHSPFRRRATFILVILGLVTSTLGMTGYALWRLHDEAVSRQFDIASLHAKAFEDHLTQHLHVVDLMMTNTVDSSWLKMDTSHLNTQLEGTLHNAPYLRSLSVVEPAGGIALSSNPRNIGTHLNLVGFQPSVSEPHAILRVGETWMGRDFYDGRPATPAHPADSQSFIPVLRDVAVSSTRWVSLLATLNTDYFLNHYLRSIDAERGCVALLRYDGTLLMSSDERRRPGSREGGEAILRRIGEHEIGHFEQVTPTGQTVLTAYRASRTYPVILVVRLDKNQSLAAWRQEAMTTLAVVLSALLLACAAATMYYLRQERAAQERDAAMGRLNLAAKVFETSTEAIVITDLSGKILTVNAAFSLITGYTATEAQGQNPRFLSSGLHNHAFFVEMWRAIIQIGHWEGEITNRRKNGETYPQWLIVSQVQSEQEDGEFIPTHYVGVGVDITLRKRTEEHLRRANVELQRFAEIAAHHLQEPARRLVSYAQRLESRLPYAMLDEESRLALEVIQTQAKRQQDLLRDVQRYLAADQPRGRVVCLDVGTLVQGLLDRYAPALEAAGVTVTVGTLPTLWMDEPRLLDIFSVLIDNVLRHAASEAPLQLTLSGEQVGQRVSYRIADNGKGIEPPYRERIFGVFERLGNSGGTGIGLAIVRRIVEHLGGQVWVEDTAVGGCTICLDLPFGAPTHE